MDALDDTALYEIKSRLWQRMVAECGLDLSALALDMTNFATFIDSANEAAPIVQRGHAKQKRTDLRLMCLGLVVTRDGGIPIVSHSIRATGPTWPSTKSIDDELTGRYAAMADPAGLSVVFDAA